MPLVLACGSAEYQHPPLERRKQFAISDRGHGAWHAPLGDSAFLPRIVLDSPERSHCEPISMAGKTLALRGEWVVIGENPRPDGHIRSGVSLCLQDVELRSRLRRLYPTISESVARWEAVTPCQHTDAHDTQTEGLSTDLMARASTADESASDDTALGAVRNCGSSARSSER